MTLFKIFMSKSSWYLNATLVLSVTLIELSNKILRMASNSYIYHYQKTDNLYSHNYNYLPIAMFEN